MNILFTICGRAGSKGIKNKNIRNFLGEPLSYYTLSAIDLFKKRTDIERIDTVVNTDSEELIEIMRENPFFSLDIIVRNKELGGDNVPKVAVIFDCLKQMQEKRGFVTIWW